MNPSMASVITRPNSGLREVIKRTESDDNGRGYERDETDAYQCLAAWKAHRAQLADPQRRLNALLLRLVAEGDARAAKVEEKTGCAV
ncbi:hypothetical protein ACWDFH_25740 [Streptomyces kronopolitis]